MVERGTLDLFIKQYNTKMEVASGAPSVLFSFARSVPNGSDLRSRIVNGRSALPTNVFGPWKDERRCVPLFGKLGASRRLGFVQKDPFF